ALVLVLIFGGWSAVALAQSPTANGPGDVVTDAPATSTQSKGRQKLTFFQIVFSGGPLGIANMVVLIGLSITALALAADDLRIVRKSRLIPDNLSDTVRDLMAADEIGQARSACKAHPS